MFHPFHLLNSSFKVDSRICDTNQKGRGPSCTDETMAATAPFSSRLNATAPAKACLHDVFIVKSRASRQSD
jgi:hypothetical protein